MKFVWARRNHNSTTGHLLENPTPSAEDLAWAFPLAPPDYNALAHPASESLDIYSCC